MLMCQALLLLRSMLPSQFYWIGVNRESSDAFWAYLDGTALPQVASNSPYAHWSWNTNAFTYDAARTTWNCIQVSSTAWRCNA